jgi:hypothetical protein
MSRRYKAAYLTEEDLISAFVQPFSAQFFTHVQILGLPEGFQIKRIGHDYMRYSLYVVFEHESWPEVPADEYPPEIQINIRYVQTNAQGQIIKEDQSWRGKEPML